MVFGLLFSLLPLLLVFVLVRAVTGRGKIAVGGHPVRHFFQYMLLYGLMIVVAVGLTGLLELVLPHEQTIYSDRSGLARALAFTLVGIPLLALMVNWTRRRFAAEPAEKLAFGWGIYLAFAGITTLVIAMQALQETLQWALGNGQASANAIATAVVWGAAWALNWWLDRVVTPNGQTRLHHIIGSIITLVWAATGLGMLVAALLKTLLPFDGDKFVVTGGNAIANAAVTFVVGALAWYFYWIRTYAGARRDGVWEAYTMVVGIAGGLVTAVVAASVVLYKLLVWVIGNPASDDAAQHFRSVPASAGALFVGVLVWWYHRAVLAEAARTARTEGQRIYEYLIGAIGLVAAATGLTVMLAAVVETATEGSTIAGAGGPRNTLLLATTLLVVGAPVWWIFWRRIERAVGADRTVECGSPARRFYLFMLFGIGGTAAVISLLVAVYQLFDDIVSGDAGSGTLRNMRWALGVLITAGAVAGYHWLVYRAERDVVGARDKGPKYVLLVGVADRELAGEVSDATAGHVDAWLGIHDVDATAWSVDAVLGALADVDAEEVVVVSLDGRLRAIPVDRR